MKSANLQNDITESVGTAENDVYPAEDAFPFGAYRMNTSSSLVRQGTVICLQSVGFCRKTGGTAGCIASRPDCRTGLFYFEINLERI